VSRLTRGSFSLVADGFRLFGIVVALLLAGSERRAVHAGLTTLSLASLVGYIVLFTLRIS